MHAKQELEYGTKTEKYFGTAISRDIRNVKLSSSYPLDSPYFDRCYTALLSVELECIEELINGLGDKRVPGAFVEFGIFQGAWIKRLHEMTEKAGLSNREIYGFDSFQGLSVPHEKFDSSFWKEGMYAAPRVVVEANVGAADRPRIKLVEGFFSESLKGAEAAKLTDVAFARIDCDIYEPAKQCLEFLSDRLAHGSILVFDDWSHDFALGEARAFEEWVETVPHLNFKFIFLGPWDHLHLRVLHEDKEDIF
jgi:hypothetical protein